MIDTRTIRQREAEARARYQALGGFAEEFRLHMVWRAQEDLKKKEREKKKAAKSHE
jgi:hypothetical protein